MELTTITNIIEEFPRFKDVSDLVKFYVLSEIKGGACCGHMYIIMHNLKTILFTIDFLQVNVEFEMLYPDECNNFFTKWGNYFKERIIMLGKQEYPAVQQIIKNTKNSKLLFKNQADFSP